MIRLEHGRTTLALHCLRRDGAADARASGGTEDGAAAGASGGTDGRDARAGANGGTDGRDARAGANGGTDGRDARDAGPTLLLLHALRGSSEDWRAASDGAAWPGAIFALDFSGHGRSGWLRGGGYHPEIFAADADLALAEIGPAFVVGAGVGAYAALLLAGARPDLVPAALLLPGRGLDGGGAEPDPFAIARGFESELRSLESPPEPPLVHDPLVRHAETDVRPIAYASAFAKRARRLVLVAGDKAPPPWWQVAAALEAVESVAADGAPWSELAARHLLRAPGTPDTTGSR